MMARTSYKKVAPKKVSKSDRDFEDMMRDIPMVHFVNMVNKSAIPAPDARELCNAFRELRR